MATADVPPACAIRVSGRALPQALLDDVVGVEVVTEVARLGRATITVRNWVPDAHGTLLDAEVGGTPFAVGRDIAIDLGWGSELGEVFDGLVVSVSVVFGEVGYPQLEIGCRCRGVGLVGRSAYRVWRDSTDLAAVRDLADAAGLSVDGAAGETVPQIVQYGASDWGFILARAAALGRQAYVRGRTLHFAPAAATGRPVATLAWSQNLYALRLTDDLTPALGSATARAWDSDQKRVVTATARGAARWVSDRRPTPAAGLSTAGLTAVRATTHAAAAALPPSELEAWSDAVMDRRGLAAQQGTGRCRGQAGIAVDATIEIAGTSPTHDGVYYVTRTRHVFGRGRYETEFTVGAPPALAPRYGRSTEELVPRAQGTVVGTVESYDDSEKRQGRVQIRLPWMADDAPALWARLAMPGAGPNRGLVYVPEPGDEVVVQFVGDDPRYPVVVGALWNGQDAPPVDYDPAKNTKRAIVSRSGHKLVFDDGESGGQVLVETQAGQRIVVDDQSGAEAIRLTDKTGNTVFMDRTGLAFTAAPGASISLSAASGSITMSAKEVSVTAVTSVDVVASETASLRGLQKVEVQGAQVAIAGAAEVSVQAALVRLN